MCVRTNVVACELRINCCVLESCCSFDGGFPSGSTLSRGEKSSGKTSGTRVGSRLTGLGFFHEIANFYSDVRGSRLNEPVRQTGAAWLMKLAS